MGTYSFFPLILYLCAHFQLEVSPDSQHHKPCTVGEVCVSGPGGVFYRVQLALQLIQLLLQLLELQQFLSGLLPGAATPAGQVRQLPVIVLICEFELLAVESVHLVMDLLTVALLELGLTSVKRSKPTSPSSSGSIATSSATPTVVSMATTTTTPPSTIMISRDKAKRLIFMEQLTFLWSLILPVFSMRVSNESTSG